MQLRCGVMFNNDFVANLLMILSVQEFLKSVSIWRRYGQKSSVLFWFTVYIIICHPISTKNLLLIQRFIWSPHLIMVPWTHSTHYSIQHLDQVSHFSTIHTHYQLLMERSADRQNSHRNRQVPIGR